MIRSFNLSANVKISVLSILLALGTIACQNKSAQTESDRPPVVDVLKLTTGENNPRNSEGDFITLKDGRILYIYSHYTGTSASDHASAYLAGRYSSDNGKTWTDEDVKIVDQEGTMNVMSVSLLRMQNGKIALFYLRKNSTTDCIPMMRISDDDAKTWSDPRPVIRDRPGYFVLNNNRVIQLKDGRLLLAVALHQNPGDTVMNRVGRLWSYYSDDDGATWTASDEVANPDNIIIQEPGLIELKDGNMLMFSRTMENVQYFSWSKDRGETWSDKACLVPASARARKSPLLFSRRGMFAVGKRGWSIPHNTYGSTNRTCLRTDHFVACFASVCQIGPTPSYLSCGTPYMHLVFPGLAVPATPWAGILRPVRAELAVCTWLLAFCDWLLEPSQHRTFHNPPPIQCQRSKR